MTIAQIFWTIVCIACVLWYSTVTIYVAIRGVFDIKHMLGTLEEKENTLKIARNS